MNGLYANSTAGQPLTQMQTVLANPVMTDGAALFRHTVYLVVPVDEICERVSLTPDASLAVQFSPATIDISHTSGAWNTSPWVYEDERVMVDLVMPIRVHRLDSEGYGKAALHRMDGDKVIEDPTFTVATNKTITDEFLASRFAVTLSSPGKQPNAGVQSAINAASGMQNIAKAMVQEEQPMAAGNAKKGLNVANAMDQQEMLEMLEVLYGYSLEAIVVHGQPTTPRLRLMSADNAEVLWQWLEFPGVQTTNCSVTVTAEQLQPALDRAFAARGEGELALDRALVARGEGETELVLPLIIESDAPCTVDVHAQYFTFKRQANLLPDGEPLSLRFSGRRQETHTLPLKVLDVTVELLELALSVAKGDGAVPAVALPAIDSLSTCGFRLQAGDRLAAPVELASGSFIRGYTLPWWPLEADAKLSLALYADQGNTPVAGQPLVTAALTAQGDVPQWLMFGWEEKMLQPGRYWLQLAVEDGSGLWLADDGESQLHRHYVHVAPELISAPQTPLQFALVEAGTSGAASVLQIFLNGAPVAVQTEGEQWHVRLQSLPVKPWVVGLKMEQGGLVTVNRGVLWY